MILMIYSKGLGGKKSSFPLQYFTLKLSFSFYFNSVEFQENSNRGKHSVCCLKFICPFSFNGAGFGDILSFEFSSPSPPKYNSLYMCFYVTKVRQYWVPFILKISHYPLHSKHISEHFEGNGSSGVLVLIPILSHQKLMNC